MGPTSKRAPERLDRAKFLEAAANRLGIIEGRMQSKSALIGLSKTRDSLPPPKRTASSCFMNEKVRASVMPRPARALRARTRRACNKLSAAVG